MNIAANHKEHVFKILRQPEWDALARHGSWSGSPDDLRDGFIHLSAADQVAGTLQKHFAGQTDLVLAVVATATFGPELKWETSRGGALFPHLYGPLHQSMISGNADIPETADQRTDQAVSVLIEQLVSRS